MLSRILIVVSICLGGCVKLPAGPTDGARVPEVLHRLKEQLKDVKAYEIVLPKKGGDVCTPDFALAPGTVTLTLKEVVNSTVTSNASIPVAVVPFAPTFTNVFTSINAHTVTMTVDGMAHVNEQTHEVVLDRGRGRKYTSIAEMERDIRNYSRKKITEEEPTLNELVLNFLYALAIADNSKPCLGFIGKTGERYTGKGSLKIQIDFQVTQKVDGGVGLTFQVGKIGGDLAQTNDVTNSMILEMVPTRPGTRY